MDRILVTFGTRPEAIKLASTVSLELCMFDKPVINVGYNPPSVSEGELSYARYYRFDHYAPVVASGAVEVAISPAEMRDMIKRAFVSSNATEANRQRLLKQMFGWTLDGLCIQRATEVLLKLAMSSLQR
jgi:hypothetical protein